MIGRFIYPSQGKGKVEGPKLRKSARILKRSMRALKNGKFNSQGQPMFNRDPQIKMELVFQEKRLG